MFKTAISISLAAAALLAGQASAATRFAAPQGPDTQSQCTDPAAACALPTALTAAGAGDTISLAPGNYDVRGLALPKLLLHWKTTVAGTEPVLTSANAAVPTIALQSSQSGSTFDDLQIENTSLTGTALSLEAGVDATVRSTVITGPHCVEQADGDQLEGELTIEDSTLSNPAGRTCAVLGVGSILRRSTVTQTNGIAMDPPPPAVLSAGLVEDTRIVAGLKLIGTRAVARRVVASGATAISGEGLVVDSLAQATGTSGAAIAVDTPNGGTLRVINSTAVASSAPALQAADAQTQSTPLASDFNFLKVTNTIARGVPDLRVKRLAAPCPPGGTCTEGRIVIDHSNFATRDPAAGGVVDPIVLGLGNQSGDPLFANPATGDFHVLANSPAIDAGDDPSGRALPSDLDGHPRVQGLGVDIGAFELTPPTAVGVQPPAPPPTVTRPPGAVPPPPPPPPRHDTTAPTLSRPRLSRTHFHANVAATLTATTNEPGQLRVLIQRHRRTRWTTVGTPLLKIAAHPGEVKLDVRRRLPPGSYRFLITDTDTSGNRSAARSIAFTVTP